VVSSLQPRLRQTVVEAAATAAAPPAVPPGVAVAQPEPEPVLVG
jgi:hypothetical protein